MHQFVKMDLSDKLNDISVNKMEIHKLTDYLNSFEFNFKETTHETDFYKAKLQLSKYEFVLSPLNTN